MAYTTIDDPSAYFQTLLYTGDGNDNRNLVNTGNSDLQPDWIWNKRRDSTSNHFIFDSSRGTSKIIVTDTTEAEGTNTNQLQAFQTDGFQLGSDNGSNGSSRTMVAWQWKANGGTETTNQSESGSQIACSVQANTTAGFSIITYTGTGGTGHTFLHGLGSAPAWFIIKRRSGTEDWLVYHHKNTSQPETDHLLLNTTDATSDSNTRFDDTAPNGTEIALGNNAVCNADASTYVCYAFKEVQGYSKFGVYTGNGNADGPFIYTGFKPAFLIIKNTSDGDDQWIVWDNKRSTFNPVDDYLSPSASDAESANSNWAIIDFVSNGFKLRSSDISYNQNTYNYIYMAFAESPFVSSEGVPTTAR
jgi:hypothetical protein